MDDSSSASGTKRKRDGDNSLATPKSVKASTAAQPDVSTKPVEVSIPEQPGLPSKPGSRGDPSSFIQDFKNEPLVGAYLGFTNTKELRHFVRSSFLLFFLAHFEGGWPYYSKEAWSRVLNTARRSHLDHKKIAAWGGLVLDTSKIDTYRPTSFNTPPGHGNVTYLWEYDQEKRDTFLAHILVLLVAEVDVRSPGPPVLLSEYDAGKLKRLQKEEKTAYGILELTDPSDIVWPRLHTGFEVESDLEPYNRALVLLTYARNAFQIGVFREANDVGIDTTP